MTASLLVTGASSAGLTGTTAIRSVTFTGTPAKPIVTVSGSGLKIPPPDPDVSPSNQPLCPRAIHGNAGFDYGTRFYLVASANGKQKLAAGRYRPKLNELDCIGIIVLSSNPTKVRFRLGAAYKEFGYAQVMNGDRAKVVLNGSSFGLTVRYG